MSITKGQPVKSATSMHIIAFNSENNIEQIRSIGGKFIFYVTSGTYIYHWDLNGKRYKQQIGIPRLFTAHVIYSRNVGELDLASDTVN